MFKLFTNTEKNLNIDRIFTKGLKESSSVYDMFEWKKVDVVLKDYSSGNTIADMKNLEFPSKYSQNACDIIATKYFRKRGLGKKGEDGEFSLKQVVHRMVNFWTLALLDAGMINQEQLNVLYDELAYSMLAQMWAPNSPQWFNTGLMQAYDIKGNSNGHFYYDQTSQSVKKATDSYTRTQGSACFILGIEDSLLGEKSLTETINVETLLFKYGSGVGSNWSKIRAKNELLSGGGRSSGLLSFLKVSDKNAGAIKSGGTTRRAAKMNILDLDHPEIIDFINWKSLEEDKALALGKMGYSTSFDGEAYDTISGQNANNSVRIPDKFMQALSKNNVSWKLKGRIDKSVNGEYSVHDIWENIASAAWRCGDPGVQYDDIINTWHTSPLGEDGKLAHHNRINGSNPCSEYLFLDDTACNLASINVLKFYDGKNESFDIEGYTHLIKLIQLVLESTIHWGQFPTADIARKSYKFRTTGLGLTNIGALFMHMGLAYDSDEARNLAAALCSIMTGYSYYTSALMAKTVAPFECYEQNKEYMQRVIQNHAATAVTDIDFIDMPYSPICINHDVLEKIGFKNVSESLQNIWQLTINAGKEYGFRNAQVSVLAPTGTIAFAMDCDSTSSEPFFSHVAYKKLVGGGFMTIVNNAIPKALATLGYKEQQIDDIVDYIMKADEYGMVLDGKIEDAPHLLDAHLPIFDTANKCGTGSRFISPEAHVKMMGALSPHISGAISKTVNMPNNASVQNIKDIYSLSWQLGVKAIALYRDGCKSSQPLNTVIANNGEKPFTEYTYNELIDYINNNMSDIKRLRPKGIRNAHVHEGRFEGGTRVYVITTFYGKDEGAFSNKLAELFIVSGKHGSFPKGLLESLGITISKMLQYGMAASDISKMYKGQTFEPSGCIFGHPYIKEASSISDFISQIIDLESHGFDISAPANSSIANNHELSRIKPTGIRRAELHEAKVGQEFVYVLTSFFGINDEKKQGHLAEVFCFSDRQGSATTKGLLSNIATTISKTLQYGLRPEDIARMYLGQKYEPSGTVFGHPFIKSADSISDLIGRIIYTSIGNYDYCQVKPKHYTPKSRIISIEKGEYTEKDLLYSEVCHNCGSDKMVQSGICKVCINCGTTTGCS